MASAVPRAAGGGAHRTRALAHDGARQRDCGLAGGTRLDGTERLASADDNVACTVGSGAARERAQQTQDENRARAPSRPQSGRWVNVGSPGGTAPACAKPATPRETSGHMARGWVQGRSVGAASLEYRNPDAHTHPAPLATPTHPPPRTQPSPHSTTTIEEGE